MPKRTSNSRSMLELDTILHKAFKPLVDVMSNNSIWPNKPLTKSSSMQKIIPINIEKYLSPLAIGTWFCGDGGRRDYGENQGKAIQLHTQGFTEECCNRLAAALESRYNWKIRVVYDKDNRKGVKTFILQIEASSFESFTEIVMDYILPHFQQRLPSQRSPKSRFKPN